MANNSRSGRFLDYLLERPDVAPIWRRYVHHPFVLALGDGTLPMESFKGYLVQDYLYLVGPGPCFLTCLREMLTNHKIQFARANALASYKSRNLDDIASVCSMKIIVFLDRQYHRLKLRRL